MNRIIIILSTNTCLKIRNLGPVQLYLTWIGFIISIPILNCFPLQKHGIVLGPDLATNGETEEEVGKADQNSQTASAEIREGSSVLGKLLFLASFIAC